MSGRATLTIELSMTCISAASTTAKAMRYLCGSPRSAIAAAAVASARRSGSTGLGTATAVSRSGLAKSLPGGVAVGGRLAHGPLASGSRAILHATGANVVAPLGERVLDAREDESVDVVDVRKAVTHDARLTRALR